MPSATSFRIDDGHATLIEFSEAPNLKLYEKEVTPPGLDGAGGNNTTTMRNVEWRTFAPKKLKTMTELTASVAYATDAVYQDMPSLLQVNQLITVTFPDGSTVEFWGFIDKLAPQRNTEGNQPTMELTVVCTNQDDTGAEVAPVYTAPAA
jgi:hypothetical protein